VGCVPNSTLLKHRAYDLSLSEPFDYGLFSNTRSGAVLKTLFASPPVKEQKTELETLRVEPVVALLAEQWMRITVARYPGRAPVNFAISRLCWNSPQSILSRDLTSPVALSAAASTNRVFPVPVSPRNKRHPAGRPGALIPSMNLWYARTTSCTASSCPTSLLRKRDCRKDQGAYRVRDRDGACVPVVYASSSLLFGPSFSKSGMPSLAAT
jgi:hypothetical protein